MNSSFESIMTVPIRRCARREDFPSGLQVLVVDHDLLWLGKINEMLRSCNFKATLTSSSSTALRILRENKGVFDVVLCEVQMPQMDGLDLLQFARQEMDVPFIMMSIDSSTDVVMKSITLGACDYIVKPIYVEQLKNVWQHVVREKMKSVEGANRTDTFGAHNGPVLKIGEGSSAQGNSLQNFITITDSDDEALNGNGFVESKEWMAWTPGLQKKFAEAVQRIGVDNANPREILILMNTPGLTEEQVSHRWQRYRSCYRGNFEALNGKAPSAISDLPARGVSASSDLPRGSVDFNPLPSQFSLLPNRSPVTMQSMLSPPSVFHGLNAGRANAPAANPGLNLQPLHKNAISNLNAVNSRGYRANAFTGEPSNTSASLRATSWMDDVLGDDAARTPQSLPGSQQRYRFGEGDEDDFIR